MLDKGISEEAEQILLGSILGDGTMKKTTHKANYSEVHSIRQKDYLLWKNDRCFRIFKTKIRTYRAYEKKQQKYYRKIVVRTRVSPLLYNYHRLFYPENRKTISQGILDKIDRLGLAVWYCDDGNYHFSKRIVRIMTDCFSFYEQKIIRRWFKDRWDLECKITKRKRGSYHLEFNVKESDKFLRLIQKEVPESMFYKLGHIWEGNGKRIQEALKRDSESKKIYYIKNKEKILQRQNEYRKRHEIKKREKITKHEYYLKNKERILTRTKKYRQLNKEKVKNQKEKYYKENKNRISLKKKKYYLRNRDKILKRQMEYKNRPEIKVREKISKHEFYLKNKERILTRTREYQKRNKEKIRRWRIIYLQKNKERISAQRKTYYLKNRDKILKKQKEYKKRLKIKGDTYTMW